MARVHMATYSHQSILLQFPCLLLGVPCEHPSQMLSSLLGVSIMPTKIDHAYLIAEATPCLLILFGCSVNAVSLANGYSLSEVWFANASKDGEGDVKYSLPA